METLEMTLHPSDERKTWKKSGPAKIVDSDDSADNVQPPFKLSITDYEEIA